MAFPLAKKRLRVQLTTGEDSGGGKSTRWGEPGENGTFRQEPETLPPQTIDAHISAIFTHRDAFKISFNININFR